MTATSVYQDRIARAQAEMRAAGVDLLCIGPSADLFYLTGINAHLSERLNLLLVPAERSAEIRGAAPGGSERGRQGRPG